MLFNSIDFLIFFPIVTVLYFVIGDRLKRYWLLAASYYFYMCWNARYIVLIMISTVITYLCALVIERYRKARNLTLAVCIVSNLLILFFFKYYGFTADIATDLMAVFGIRLKIPVFDVMLPVGISFYTFQALGYTIDVYRGKVSAEKDIVNYALFVSFFPQLVAGPIERTASLLPQVKTPHRFDPRRFREGFLMMLWGFFLKVVIADRIAIIVDTVYDNVPAYPGLYQVMAAGLFAFQIYCDFGGYSTIAVGTAKILGIDIMENFDAPYMASSVTDFWRRWHISLTTWFRDYLYIPLGGNRKGKARKYLNKLVVFAVSGLWHGADWSYVIWGALNGLYQVIGEILTPARRKIRGILHINERSRILKVISVAVTFVLVDLAWVFFRASTVAEAITVFRQMFSAFNPEIIFTGKIYTLGVEADSFRMMTFCILILVIADIIRYNRISVRDRILAAKAPVRVAAVVFFILFILVFGVWGPAFDITNFIYFQF